MEHPGAAKSLPGVFILTALVLLTVYLLTLPPTLTWAHYGADGGDLVTAVIRGRLPHPPGFPTYLLLGTLFVQLPWGEPAWRLNLMSAVMAAGASLLTAAAFQQTASRRPRPAICNPQSAIRNQHSAIRNPQSAIRNQHSAIRNPQSAIRNQHSAICSLALGLSPLLWSQALIAEVYAPAAFFTAAVLFLALRRTPAWLLGIVWGLGIGVHPTLLFLAPLVLWQVAVSAPRPSAPGLHTFLPPAFLLLASLLLAPPSSTAPSSWPSGPPPLPGPTSPPRRAGGSTSAVASTTGTSSPCPPPSGRSGSWPGPACWPASSPRSARSWPSGDGGLSGGNIALLLSPPPWPSAVSASTPSVTTPPTRWSTWSRPCLWRPSGWGWGWQRRRKYLARYRRHAPWALLFLPLAQVLLFWGQMDLHGDRTAMEWAHRVLQQAPPGAVLVTAQDAHTFTLWYAHDGLGQRPDLLVVDRDLWYHLPYRRMVLQELGLKSSPTRLDEALARTGRPVVEVTNGN
jgi:hypothetical protein